MSEPDGADLVPVAPPPEGPLGPVPGGWLIRRVEGRRLWRALPRGLLGAFVAMNVVPPLLGGAATMALARLVLTDDTFPFVFLTTLPLLISPLLGPRLARGWTRRYLARRVPLASVRDRKRGDTVMLAGTIRAGAWFETTGDKHRAVIANYTGGGLLTAAVSRPWTETRALDFVVDLPGGEAVRVSVRDAYLADREDPFGGLTRLASDANVAETSVGPGDEVEVLGVLDFDIDADAAGPGRSARLAPVLRAGTLTPLLVCPKKAAP